MSRKLYWYMCQNIVGTEDHVKQIRLLNAVKDNLSISKTMMSITSGSFGEGLQMRGSDLDIMMVYRTIEVYDVKPSFNPNIAYLSMQTEGVKPGFTQLRLEYMTFRNLFDCCVNFADQYYLSNKLWKQRFGFTMGIIHGPCISDSKGINDIADCLHCKTWGHPANIYHDAVSGWLMLASFFYKIKQYTKALHIIMYSISKCTFEKLNGCTKMSNIHHQLFKLKSLQDKSIVHLWRLIFVDVIEFEHNSILIPNELALVLNNSSIAIPSAAYAVFLNCLCHYHLKNVRQCQESFKVLQWVITNNYLIPDRRSSSTAFHLLDIAFQFLGDTESARQA
ncbi:unnamed protein product [Mytilus coruscus]|uniref:Uncharacterized protein n=1 Tax=Mytilus coruscus TaxID=42192 RepID=A0A6J8EQN0_MYTCO|nr:unnamed protein product [Mytilus coruscus]